MFVKEIMETKLVEVRREATVEEVLALISQYELRDFLVVDEESRFLGLVYEDDLLKLLFEDGELIHSLDILKRTHITKIMKTELPVVLETDSIKEAGSKMLRRKVNVAAVVQGERAVGMIRQSTILLHLGRQLLNAPKISPADEPERPAGGQVAEDEGDGEEYRFFERVAITIPVAYRLTSLEDPAVLKGGGRIAETVDMSAGGFLMRTREELSPGWMLSVVFDLFKGEKPIRRLCRVVRCIRSKEKPGFYQTGVMFLGMSSDERKKINAYLKEAKGKKT